MYEWLKLFARSIIAEADGLGNLAYIVVSVMSSGCFFKAFGL